MMQRTVSPPPRIQPIQQTQTIYRSRSPEPPVYYNQNVEQRQIRQKLDDQLQLQVSGIGNPSISFGNTGSSVRINAYPIKTPDGTDYYEGDLNEKGEFHGMGKYYYSKYKHQYHGMFQRGKPHGKGTLYKSIFKTINNVQKSLTSNLQLIYEGEWKNGLKNGQGKYYYGSENHYYQGPWVNDQRHGNYGTYVSPIGKYYGRWEKGKMQGRGQFLYNKTNTKYQGNFINNELDDGVIIYPNKDQYKGRVKNGLREDNQGRYAFNRLGEQPDQIRYSGGWRNDIKSDNSKQATVTYLDGQSLKGIFQNNKFIDTNPFEYRWPDGYIFHGWFQKPGNSTSLKGVVKGPNGKPQYQV